MSLCELDLLADAQIIDFLADQISLTGKNNFNLVNKWIVSTYEHWVTFFVDLLFVSQV